MVFNQGQHKTINSSFAGINSYFLIILFILNGLINNNYEFSLLGIHEYFKLNPENWIFVFIIIVSGGLFGFILGRGYSDRKIELENKLLVEKEQTKKVFHFTERLREGNYLDEEILETSGELSKSLINLRDELK